MTKEQKKLNRHLYYLANRERELAKARLYNINNREAVRTVSSSLASRNRVYINQVKNKPCMDCKGTFPPCVMEFDHRDRTMKYAALGNLASSHCSIKKIQEEIDKCDLVCSNCHAIRTYQGKHFLKLVA